MENWQFFLQKEGDEAWLPLETPQVEILEGRYQLIAHTQAIGQTVNVEIRHLSDGDDVIQETIQESCRIVQSPGKVEILPDLYLGLGSWKILCHLPECLGVDGTESKIAEHHNLEIQVLSQDFDLFEDWEFIESQHCPDPAPLEPSILMPHPPVFIEEPLVAMLSMDAEMDVALESAPTAIVSSSPKNEGAKSLSPTHRDEVESSKTMTPQSVKVDPPTLCLPVLSKKAPQISFRTVKSQQLPLPISAKVSISSRKSPPELPSFTRGKSVALLQRQTRQRTIDRMKVIATVMDTQAPHLSQIATTQRFHSTLNQLASSQT